jgi:hypothetical protein
MIYMDSKTQQYVVIHWMSCKIAAWYMGTLEECTLVRLRYKLVQRRTGGDIQFRPAKDTDHFWLLQNTEESANTAQVE